MILPSCQLCRSAASATVRSACLHRSALTLVLSRHPALHVSESAAAQPPWAWPPPTVTDRRPGVLCRSMYTCCVVCVYHVGVYACMHVHAMCLPWLHVVQLQSQAYHANNKDKHSQTGEPACAGHPITADRMPRTEGSSRLLCLSLSTSARSAFSRLLPTTARRYGLGPLFDLHSYAKTVPKPPRTTTQQLSPLYTLQPCVARWLRSPI